MKFAHGFYWPKTEQHFIEYLDSAGHSEYQIVPKTALDIVVNSWSCVIDIGAHVGTWSRWFAKRAKQVYSFEPIKTNYACLEKNLEDYPNCILYNNAVSDMKKYITLWKPQKLSNTGTFSSVPIAGWNELRYRAIAIDDLNVAPSVIKIDIQGGEYPALRGARQTIKTHQPVICWENSKENTDKENIYNFLTNLGYNGIFQYKEDAIWVPAGYVLNDDQQEKLRLLFRSNQKIIRH